MLIDVDSVRKEILQSADELIQINRNRAQLSIFHECLVKAFVVLHLPWLSRCWRSPPAEERCRRCTVPLVIKHVSSFRLANCYVFDGDLPQPHSQAHEVSVKPGLRDFDM